MPNRRVAPSSTPPPRLAGGSAKGPTREALLAALAERERELAEAQARQTATAEILRVISQSPTDARPVFEEIIGACQTLFGSDEIGVYTIGDDEMVRVAAWRGPRAEEVRHDVTPLAESATGRIIRERRTHHIPDLRAEPNLSPTVRERVNRLGGASLLYAPMLWEDRGLGSILVVRSPPKPFSDREQALLQSFADQAATAIQNARLFRETQEALQQQTATAEVLKVISRSAFDLQKVLDTLVTSAVKLCGAGNAILYLKSGDAFSLKATSIESDDPGVVRRLREHPPVAGRGSIGARILLTGEIQHVSDIWGDAEYDPALRAVQVNRGLLGVPLKRDETVVGAIVLARRQPGAYTQRQIELAETFADQAVIAIENSRLFNEVQARTRDLTEALQQQTATADVLKVISRSAFDLNLAASTILEAAARLCHAPLATLHLRDGDVCRLTTQFGLPEAFEREARKTPIPVRYPLHSRRTARAGEVAHYSDAWVDPDYLYKSSARLGGYRAIVVVPLMREGELVGIFSLGRPEPDPFTESQIKLTQTFADQAAIAIENARLFNEVKARTEDLSEALEQQTATADVLKVISRSVFDLQTVLDTLVESAYVLCDAGAALLYLRSDDGFECKAIAGAGAEDVGHLFKGRPIRAGRSTAAERVIMTGEVHSITDLFDDPDVDPKITAGLRGAGLDFRSTLAVPMKRNDAVVGVLVIARGQTGSFPQRQVDLLQTFADQAVIAIENVRLFDEVQARTRDLTEALQQQTATSEVLKVISRSAFDLQAVFNTLIASAVELAGAVNGTICLREGDGFRYRANSRIGMPSDFVKYLADHPPTAGRGSAAGRVILSGRIESIPDVLQDPDYVVPVFGFNKSRSVLGVPLLRNDRVEGALVLGRVEPGAFTERQIEIVQTFADQAVIAIENVRLFDEVQARTRDLEESLRRQTATSDILRVIASSPGDMQPVLDRLAETTCRLCEAYDALVLLREGDDLRFAAHHGSIPIPATFNKRPISRDWPPGRAVVDRKPVHVHDLAAGGEYPVAVALSAEAARGTTQALAWRTALAMPLMREGEPVGVIVLRRAEVSPFSDAQIALLETFADQAVIAIENARLFDEVQARTRDLTEALQQQTATADVLKAISRTAFDLDTVLETLVSTAVRLCNATRGGQIFRRHGDVYRYAASQMDVDPAYLRHEQTTEIRPGRGTLIGRVALENRVVHIVDAWDDPEYAEKDEARVGNVRAMLGVPLLRNGEPVGAFALGRSEPVPFTQRQIELVTTFADQAVIAIENVRLFDEVQVRTRDLTEALQQQTATSEVLKVISRSAFDLQAVFNTLVASAVDLCGAYSGLICVRDGDVFRYRGRAGANDNEALARYLAEHPARPGRGTIVGRVLMSGKVEAIPDRRADPEFVVPLDAFGDTARSLVGVPLLRNDRVEGALVLTREEPGHFPVRQIEILQTFADQAVIAIENVRLFDEVQARTRELAASLDDLRKAQDRLIQSEKLASLGQLTAGIAHEIKNPLNFVNNFSALTRELVDELGETLKRAPLETGEREQADELIGTIGANLDKVVSHGKRADSIVKNMLLHSREGSGERTSVNVNVMVDEALNLAYHGARAEKSGFNVTIAKSLDEKAGAADLYAQEMTRVLLNLISNAFYATTKRKQAEGGGSYEPTVTASTRDLGHSVEISIRDNGTGIPDQVKAKMFNPFFTTKPAGEGTGLGLSLSHDIVVKQHGGALEVSTEPGSYTQFTLVLPRAGAAA
ncbi:GAF domain-containing protein [Roseiarcus sp.]|uniref:GAF domain-containing protein n=1 Tax=Roseiarcus sp. TaxID=1969460 RepID=UPI003C377753